MGEESQELQIGLPGAGCCSNRFIADAENTFVYEIMFTYCSQEKCKMCPLANMSMRAANLSRLKDSCQRIAEDVLRNGFKSMYIILVGGDSFSRWELLKEFTSWVWEQDFGLEITLVPTLCETMLTQDMKAWILRNKKKIRVTFRWNAEMGARLWNEIKVLKHSVVSTVDWCLTKENLPRMQEELCMLIKSKKQIRVEYLDLEEWKKEEFSTYIHQITRTAVWYFKTYDKIWIPAYGGHCGKAKCRNVIMEDTDGRTYPCRCLSPERLIYSTLRSIQNKDEDLDVPCAVEAYFEEKSNNQKYIKKIHSDIWISLHAAR